VDYVTKPFHFEEVYARVQTHLQLRRLEKLRDNLTHMVIHDLTSPLSVIFYCLDMVKYDAAENLSASTEKFVALARHSAEEMNNMIRSILDVNKMGAGEMKLRHEPCELDSLIRGVLAAPQPLPENRTVTFDIPESSLTAAADVGLIRRVLQNLLSNALRYTPAGGNVRIVVTPSSSEIRIAIADAGPGIAPENHQRIFEKFGQVEDSNHRLGTGLGLTFCKLAVEAHGGRIGVESEVGKGCTFWFALPRLNGGLRVGEESSVTLT
jgi:signal transduction histidine kinase